MFSFLDFLRSVSVKLDTLIELQPENCAKLDNLLALQGSAVHEYDEDVLHSRLTST